MTQSTRTTRHYNLRQYNELLVTILSDTHGVIDADVTSLVAKSDVVLHAGDIVGGQVLQALNPRLGIVIAVRGNNDLHYVWGSHEHSVLDQVPEVALVDCQGGTIAIDHGHLVHNIEMDHSPLGYQYADARLVVYGHTHVQQVDDEQLPWIVNPGAAGMTRNKGGASCCQLQIKGDHWSIESFKFQDLRQTG